MELSTERLLLRRWREEDREPYAALCADREVMRFIGNGKVLDAQSAAAQIDRFEAHWEEHGFGLWAVQERPVGAFIGFAGLSHPFFLPEVLPAVEVGWRFARAAWGRGYAQESGAAALHVAFTRLGLERVIGIAAAGNARSRRALERLGGRVERRTVQPGAGTPLAVYEFFASASTYYSE